MNRSLARAAVLSLGVLLLAGVASAQPPASYHGTAGRLRFSPPRVAHAPRIDGVIDSTEWGSAAALDSFTNIRPIEGVRDTLGTVVYVMYDDQNLYIAFRASDDPRQVQAPVVPRDQVGQGDWVGVSIDTYNDKQRAFFLCSNPIGIQMDGVDQEGQDTDMAPDFQYTSRGHVTARGYEVEMAVPFRTLRFSPGEHVTFGFQAIRDVKRSSTHTYWAPVTRNINSYFVQMGALEDLRGVRPGLNLQVNPTQTTTTFGVRTPEGMNYDDPRGRFGLGVKYGITSNLIADVTATPDFSQVEADAGVVDVNSRFAIFFPEKRPFFLEGADIFTTPINLVYTRRIADPVWGAKLTGKVGRTSLGVLAAADRSAGLGVETLPNPFNPYLGEVAQFDILRVKRDILKNSYVGFLGGQRTAGDEYNRGAEVDGRFKWNDKYSADWQGVQTWNRGRNYDGAVSRLDPGQLALLDPAIAAQHGEYRTGNGWYGRLARDTRRLNLHVTGTGVSPDFTADMGFIDRTDQMNYEAFGMPRLPGKEGGWFTELRLPVTYVRTYNYSGDRFTDEVISVVAEGDFPHASWAGQETVRRMIRLGGAQFPGMIRHAVWAGTNGWRGVRPWVTYVWGDQVVFAEAVSGRDVRWDTGADLRFSSRFDGTVSLLASTVWRDQNDSRFAEQAIPRVRLSYQFNKELALRVITELRSVRSFDVNDQLESESRTLRPDVLFSYYLRPGTVAYLGYGSMLQGADTQSLRPDQASVFTKLSYLWDL